MSKVYTRFSMPVSPVSVLDYDTVLVDQSEADMCSLKAQLERYGMDGLQARMLAMQDKFGYADTRLIPDFATLQNRVVAGTNYFNSLPSEVRAEFGHRPERFYEYIEKNPQKAQDRGFISLSKSEELLQNIKNDSKIDEVVNTSDVVESVESVEKKQSKKEVVIEKE